MDPQNLTKQEVISLLKTASTDYRIKEFSFGWTSQPCTDENKVRLRDVLSQAVAFLEGKTEGKEIKVVDQVQKRFILETRWTFCGTTYKVAMHDPDGSIVFQSIACPETFVKYSAKQMVENQFAFKRVEEGHSYVEEIQKRLPIGTYWEGRLFEEGAERVYQVTDFRSYTVSLRDTMENMIKFKRYEEFTTAMLDALRPRQDLNEKVSLP